MTATLPLATATHGFPLAPRPEPLAPYPPGLGDRQGAFAEVLGRRLSFGAPASPEQQARTAAEHLTAIAFVQPLLKQLRESDHSPPPFAPAQGEKEFRALGDAELAQRLVHATRFPIVDRLARDLLKRGGKDAHGRAVDQELTDARTPPPRPAPGVTPGADR